jgi:hypothetical protein
MAANLAQGLSAFFGVRAARERMSTQLSIHIRRELDSRGLRTLAEAAHFLGVSLELVRGILNSDRVPRDTMLIRIAGALGLDSAVLITAARRRTLPKELRGHVLPVETTAGAGEGKHRWPLSQEQCDCLARFDLRRSRCERLAPRSRNGGPFPCAAAAPMTPSSGDLGRRAAPPSIGQIGRCTIRAARS